MTLGWTAPTDTGGCALLTYELYINDGLGGSSFQGIDSLALLNRPYLTQHTVTNEAGADASTSGAPLVTGRTYRFKLRALNEVGSVESTNYAEIVVASTPLAPPTPPSQDFSLTDKDRTRVSYASMGSDSLNGGSAILGYDLWRDDGRGGDLETVYGSGVASQSILALQFTDFNVVKGTTYRYMYRARNINGWGDFSGVAYLRAASVPERPPAPSLLLVDDDQIALQLYTSTDTGGAPIEAYELWVDQGALNSAFTKVSSYSGSISTLTHTLGRVADSLTAGRLYSLQFRSRN